MTMPATKEYGELTSADHSIRTTLASGIGKYGSKWSLVHRTAGYECAGSCARYTKECWSVDYERRDGITGGQSYKTEAEARAHFERVTKS